MELPILHGLLDFCSAYMIVLIDKTIGDGVINLVVCKTCLFIIESNFDSDFAYIYNNRYMNFLNIHITETFKTL